MESKHAIRSELEIRYLNYEDPRNERGTGTLAEYAKKIGEEPIILTVDGKPTAALISIENADLETITLSTNSDFIALIERSRKRY